jgi:hypothetical protein
MTDEELILYFRPFASLITVPVVQGHGQRLWL